MEAVNRKGESFFYPLLSFSIGVVTADAILHCHSHIEVADLASAAKHHAKATLGNSYFVNRRKPK